MRLAVLLLVVACSSHATKPHDGPAARVVPTLDTSCQSDLYCDLASETLVDSPQTYACCPGCTPTAVSVESYTAFRAWCSANPPPMCPPISCAMPLLQAVCDAGHCVAKRPHPTEPPSAVP